MHSAISLDPFTVEAVEMVEVGEVVEEGWQHCCTPWSYLGILQRFYSNSNLILGLVQTMIFNKLEYSVFISIQSLRLEGEISGLLSTPSPLTAQHSPAVMLTMLSGWAII